METIDKYGLPITCRVPASVKKELSSEATDRGMSFAAYLSTFVVSHHQKSENNQAEIKMLFKEKEALQSNYIVLKESTNWYHGDHKETIDILLNNESILHSFFEKYGDTLLDKKTLNDAGFNFSYITNGFKKDNLSWLGVFSIYFAHVNDKIKISKL